MQAGEQARLAEHRQRAREQHGAAQQRRTGPQALPGMDQPRARQHRERRQHEAEMAQAVVQRRRCDQGVGEREQRRQHHRQPGQGRSSARRRGERRQGAHTGEQRQRDPGEEQLRQAHQQVGREVMARHLADVHHAPGQHRVEVETEMRERAHRGEHIARRHRRPRPEQRAEGQRDRRRRQQREYAAQEEAQAPVRLQGRSREHADAEVEDRKHRSDAQPEGAAERDAQPRQYAPGRRGQGVEHAHAEVQGPQHRGGEGDVLGVGEHRPRPGTGEQQQHERRQPRPLAGQPTCEQPGAGQPGEAEAGRDQVAQVPQRRPLGHAGALQGSRDEVEEAAIQIEVLVFESLAVGKPRQVEVEQQAAVDMLDLLVVADAVPVEGEQHEHPGQRQHGERDPACERAMRCGLKGHGRCLPRRGRRPRRRARRDHRSRSGLRSKPSRSETRNSGRPFTSVKIRPTYSPSTPRLMSWIPDRNSPDTISDT